MEDSFIMNWYFDVIYKYAVFEGRARRKEFWLFYMFNLILMLIAVYADNITELGSIKYYIGPFFGVYTLFVMLPLISVTIRRLHDTGKSGWWVFIKLIPVIGSVWLLVILATEGNKGQNKYGNDPKS